MFRKSLVNEIIKSRNQSFYWGTLTLVLYLCTPLNTTIICRRLFYNWGEDEEVVEEKSRRRRSSRRKWRREGEAGGGGGAGGGENSDSPHPPTHCDWPTPLSVWRGSSTQCCQSTEAGRQSRRRGQEGKSRRSSSSSSLRQEAPGIWQYCDSAPRLSDSAPLGSSLGLFFYFSRQVGPHGFWVRTGSVQFRPVVLESSLLAGPETARACSRMTRPAEVDGAS